MDISRGESNISLANQFFFAGKNGVLEYWSVGVLEKAKP